MELAYSFKNSSYKYAVPNGTFNPKHALRKNKNLV